MTPPVCRHAWGEVATGRRIALKVYGKPLVYLDNAASAQKPKAVLDRVPPSAEWTVDVDPVTLLG